MNFVPVYILGLTVSFTIGPISLLIVQRCLSKGLGSGIITAVAVGLADFTCALVAFGIGTPILLFVESYSTEVHIFSGIILLAFAIYIFSSSLQAYRHKQRVSAARGTGNDFLSAYLLTIHNPLTIGVFLGILSYLPQTHSVANIILYAFVLFLGSTTGQLTIAFTSSIFRGFFQNPKSILALNTISAIGIALFALISFSRAL